MSSENGEKNSAQQFSTSSPSEKQKPVYGHGEYLDAEASQSQSLHNILEESQGRGIPAVFLSSSSLSILSMFSKQKRHSYYTDEKKNMIFDEMASKSWIIKNQSKKSDDEELEIKDSQSPPHDKKRKDQDQNQNGDNENRQEKRNVIPQECNKKKVFSVRSMRNCWKIFYEKFVNFVREKVNEFEGVNNQMKQNTVKNLQGKKFPNNLETLQKRLSYEPKKNEFQLLKMVQNIIDPTREKQVERGQKGILYQLAKYYLQCHFVEDIEKSGSIKSKDLYLEFKIILEVEL